ncbi:hypothetical protein QBA35_33905 [Streptomyces bottropensis]|uniref:Uncharacterized protein n=1 Tax=Streptomyces bottropensis TaxID=42235 RepID=A0ABU8AY52_9ACTN
MPDVSSTQALCGEVAAGPDGRATVLSREAVGSGDHTSQVSVQWQTLLTRPAIISKTTLSGTVPTGAKATSSWLRHGTVVSGAIGKAPHPDRRRLRARPPFMSRGCPADPPVGRRRSSRLPSGTTVCASRGS